MIPSIPVNVFAPVLKAPAIETKAVVMVVVRVHVELTALAATEELTPHVLLVSCPGHLA